MMSKLSPKAEALWNAIQQLAVALRDELEQDYETVTVSVMLDAITPWSAAVSPGASVRGSLARFDPRHGSRGR